MEEKINKKPNENETQNKTENMFILSSFSLLIS